MTELKLNFVADPATGSFVLTDDSRVALIAAGGKISDLSLFFQEVPPVVVEPGPVVVEPGPVVVEPDPVVVEPVEETPVEDATWYLIDASRDQLHLSTPIKSGDQIALNGMTRYALRVEPPAHLSRIKNVRFASGDVEGQAPYHNHGERTLKSGGVDVFGIEAKAGPVEETATFQLTDGTSVSSTISFTLV